MQRLIDALTLQLELAGAVLSWRPRSGVLLIVAVVAAFLMQLFFVPVLSQLAWPELAQAFRPVAGMLSLAVWLHLTVLALGTFVRDRTQFLKF